MAPLPDFCSTLLNQQQQQQQHGNDATSEWSLQLHSSAESFLQSLNLPSIHPHCTPNHNVNDALFTSAQQQRAPPMGPLDFWSYHDDDNGQLNGVGGSSIDKLWQSLITLFRQVAPAFLAMGELWLRLFAFVVSPLSLSYLLWREMSSGSNGINASSSIRNGQKPSILLDGFACVLGVASSSVLLTDSYYVHEYGRSYGGLMFIATTILSFRWCNSHFYHYPPKHLQNQAQNREKKLNLKTALVTVILSILVLVTIGLLLNSDGSAHKTAASEELNYPHPGIDLPTGISEGLYYSSSNVIMSSIASIWPVQSRTYSYEYGATPWLPTGDSRTGIPFIVNSVDTPTYQRVWVTNEDDGEAVALDIAFPFKEGGGDGEVATTTEHYHDSKKPLYVLLHGLNGGSHEEYVKDFINRRVGEGSTVVVMIARGLMDTPLKGWNGFHGARVSDVDSATKHLRSALKPNQILAGVGYSMGAIILGNYVARSGKKCHLDAAMVVSGGLDMREQLNFYRSMRLWQPMLTAGLREDIIMGKFASHYKERLTKEQFISLLRSTSISELDLHAVVAYNSYDDISHYYSDMSAMGDRPSPFASAINNASSTHDTFILEKEQEKRWGRFANVSIPTCVLHALDDPLVSWRTVLSNNDSPDEVVNSGSGHVMLLLTKSGGHVGWPLGLNPALEGWKWMNDAARDFIDSVDVVLRKNEKH